MDERWLTVDDICKYLSVSNDTVYKWIEQRGMPGQRVGRRWMFKQYEPDFVVETKTAIYMVETKSQRDMKTEDVAKKTEAALTYCTIATTFTASNGEKPWKYLLIPHDAVMHNMSVDGLASKYEVRG